MFTILTLALPIQKSTAKLPELVLASKLPSTQVSKLICLPSISRHQGTSLYYSTIPNSLVVDLLDAMGGVINCETEDQLMACMISTVYMGPLYGTMRRNRDWLMDRGGLSQHDASRLIIQQYQGMVQAAADGANEGNDSILDELIVEQTRGGLNEQALMHLHQLEAVQAYDQVMDAILSRIQGKSDGSP
jgi:pyrroline-5-carboxylate reductase